MTPTRIRIRSKALTRLFSRSHLGLGAALALGTTAAQADCTAVVDYAPLAAVAVPGLSGPLALGLTAGALGVMAWARLRRAGRGTAARLGAGLLVVGLASLLSTQLWGQATSVFLSNAAGGSAPISSPLASVTTVTNTSGVPQRISAITPGADTGVLSPGSTCSAGQVLEPSQSCQVSLGGACAAVPRFTVSGQVHNDVNGLTDRAINGPGTDAGGLHVSLVRAGAVVATSPVAANGSYSLPDVSNGSYSMVLSTTAGVVGNAPPAASLPTGWANMGEGLGAGSAGDGAPDGTLGNIVVLGADVIQVNFGIQQPPVPKDVARDAQAIAADYDYTIPFEIADFAASDPAPGGITSYHFPTFPTFGPAGTTVEEPLVTINGTEYTPDSWPAAGVTVTSVTSFELYFWGAKPPTYGTPSVTYTLPYTVVDAAGYRASSTVVLSSRFRWF